MQTLSLSPQLAHPNIMYFHLLSVLSLSQNLHPQVVISFEVFN
jgi:hypothetical protein